MKIHITMISQMDLIQIIQKKLDELNIPVIEADTGENYGRTVVFYPETGEYLIRAIGKEPRKI